jgi:L-fucose mutarotase
MLKGIDPLLTGDLLRALDQMGHGDKLVIADRNFPAYSSGPEVIHCDATSVTAVLDAILTVFPLDTFVDFPLERMGPDADPTQVNDTQSAVLELARLHGWPELEFGAIPRTEFYDRASEGMLIVQCMEAAPYCDFILTKGVV